MIETSKIIEALHYILHKIKIADKIKIIKLIYLADKYHLVHYGRTITNDDYYAMEYGPVGSTVKDVLEFDEFTLSHNEYEYASKLFEKIDNNTFKVKETIKDSEFEMLSETDIEALNFVIDKFGNMDSWKLSEYTHKYPEWYQYEDLFSDKRTKRERIRTEELLSIVDDYFGVSTEHIEESRKMLIGAYD